MLCTLCMLGCQLVLLLRVNVRTFLAQAAMHTCTNSAARLVTRWHKRSFHGANALVDQQGSTHV